MPIIRHRFQSHSIHPDTETLIVGTFNPEAEANEADFFYGRSRNFLWRLLPTALGSEDLKGRLKEEKINFIRQHRIDFVDLIAQVEVDAGEEANYDDIYLDSKKPKLNDVVAELGKLPNLKRVCLTRKTLAGIPHMKAKVDEIQHYCAANGIDFSLLKTPARTYSAGKQAIWTEFFTRP
jgi:G:T/U-mismatch repair DNA glycosylase